MPVPVEYTANGNLNPTQPWSSINIRTGVYQQTPDQVRKMAAAMQTNSMETPASMLRVYAPTGVNAVSATPGQPTLDDVLSRTAGQAPQASIFDYSGTPAGTMASAVPSISVGA